MALLESHATLILPANGNPPSIAELRTHLDKGTIEEKISAMGAVVQCLLQGERMQSLLIPMINAAVVERSCKPLQKIFLVYLECIRKTDPKTGKLLPDFLLIGDHIRRRLDHPNEYVRGGTLRFLCKIKATELLEDLAPAVRQNLTHRFAYVRRHAVSAVHSLYRVDSRMLPDAPELVEQFLETESDMLARRNAFAMLFECDQQRFVRLLLSKVDDVPNMGEHVQLVLLDAIRRICRTNPSQKAFFVKMIYDLLSSSSTAVVFQSAVVLVSLSSSPTLVRASTSALCQILTSHSDNNIKMIVIEKLEELKNLYAPVLEDLMMEILRGLNAPNLEIREKIISIALDLVTSRNAEEVIVYLKKEVQKSQHDTFDGVVAYRRILIQAIHQCAVQFPELAHTVVFVLMDFISDASSTALDVSLFLREILQRFETLREGVLSKLHVMYPMISSAKVHRVAIWIMSTYSMSREDIFNSLDVIKTSLGPLPFGALESGLPIIREVDDSDDPAIETHSALSGFTDSTSTNGAPSGLTKKATNTRVLADGTYATTSAVEESAVQSTGSGAALSRLIVDGDFFLAACVGNALTKLVLRLQREHPSVPKNVINSLMAEAMLYICGMLKYGTIDVFASRYGSSAPASSLSFSAVDDTRMDDDCVRQLQLCLRILSKPEPSIVSTLLDSSSMNLGKMLHLNEERERDRSSQRIRDAKGVRKVKKNESDDFDNGKRVDADTSISFRQLRPKLPTINFDDDFENDIQRVTGHRDEDLAGRLQRTIELTGYSDPVYVEGCLTVNDYDITLDLTSHNLTSENMENCVIVLYTVGDLQAVDRPQEQLLEAKSSMQTSISFKVSSSESSTIYGHVSYETRHGVQHNIVPLSEIHIDIVHHIRPTWCSDFQFRTMWADFEWENKVTVHTATRDLKKFVEFVCENTNLRCLTDLGDFPPDTFFLSANLYARSVFGEDTLANVSIEKDEEGRIIGFIRIRCKTQGLALALGDQITIVQKGVPCYEREEAALAELSSSV